jgi:lantibiotic biosynthesis protein
VGAYLLWRRENEKAATTLSSVLRGLIALTREEDGVPCWYTPAHLIADDTMTHLYPHGNLNCGLAHGIPGPLGLMALGLRLGVAVEGLTEAIERTADWLGRNRVDDDWGVNWPTAVPLRPNGASAASEEPSRTAWCYGSPGVARALWLAGEAIDHSGYRELAIKAMEAVYRRPLRERHIDSPTFCHGVAGLLQVTLRFAHDTGLPLFTEAAETLSEQLLSLYDPDSLLGYYSLEPGGQRVDQPSLLDGASGVVLVLLAAATDAPPTWDRLFLLS